MATRPLQVTCSQTTMRVYDFGAVLLTAIAPVLATVEPSASERGGAGWFAYALAGLTAVTMIGSVVAAMLGRRPEGDEYLRRLLGTAAIIAFYACLTVFAVWLPLVPETLPPLSGDRVMAVLLAGIGLGWFYARWRGAW